jgi:hypothetical protein
MEAQEERGEEPALAWAWVSWALSESLLKTGSNLNDLVRNSGFHVIFRQNVNVYFHPTNASFLEGFIKLLDAGFEGFHKYPVFLGKDGHHNTPVSQWMADASENVRH